MNAGVYPHLMTGDSDQREKTERNIEREKIEERIDLPLLMLLICVFATKMGVGVEVPHAIC